MDNINKILTDKRYKEKLDHLSNETLKSVANDPIKAQEVAKKGIEKLEKEKINNIEYLQEVANGIQKLAQILLIIRAKK